MKTRHRLAALVLGLALSATAHAAPLEALYDAPAMDAFFAAATPAAAAGDADALFLLGKAHHLGKGTPKDLDRAVEFYERARAKGSFRAAHNLGLIALEDGRPDDAIPLLKEALDAGLKLPTLRNLGRAYAPPDPAYAFDLRQPVAAAGRSGDAHAEAYRLTSSVNDAFDASTQYYRAWSFARHASGRERDTFDLPALRERAVHWLRIGTDQDLGAAWTNYGVLLMEEDDRDAARAALERGAAKDDAVAHYHLSRLSADRDESLDHMERAALLGLPQAHRPAQKQLAERYEYEGDLAVLARAVERMAALRAKSSEPFVRNTLPARLAWGRHVTESVAAAGTLPDRPVRLRSCALDLGQVYGDAFNIGWNTEWRLLAYHRFDEAEVTGVSGRVDKQGCATTRGDLPPKVAAAVRAGAVLVLDFPNYGLPLVAKVDPHRITLHLGPMASPRPGP